MSQLNAFCRLYATQMDRPGALITNQAPLINKIRRICPIDIEMIDTDLLPKFACYDCISKIDMIDEFMDKCMRSVDIFNEMLNVISIDVAESTDKQKTPAESVAAVKTGQDDLTDSVSTEEIRELIMKENTRKRFICTMCGLKCQSNKRLIEHTRKHTGETPFVCSYPNCLKKFKHEDGLKNHMARHAGDFSYKCDVCGKGFTNERTKLIHTQLLHSESQPRFQCNLCRRQYKYKAALDDHVNTHLGVKPFQCFTCGKTFTARSILRAHEKTHIKDRERRYVCKKCPKQYLSMKGLEGHLVTHMDEKPFACEVCGQGYSSKGYLQEHLRLHTGEKNYSCDFCGKTFARKIYLTSNI